MKNLMTIVVFVVAIFSVSAAISEDPLPYPDVGGGDTGKNVKVDGKVVKGGGETPGTAGTTKGIVSAGGKSAQTVKGSSKVMAEGKAVSTTGNPVNN